MKRSVLLIIFCLLPLVACDKQQEEPIPAAPSNPVELRLPEPKLIFQEAMEAHTFELPSEALQAWRHVGSIKPALVLFSIHPLLEAIANEQDADIKNLIATGRRNDFRQRGSFFRANPALVPTQTVSAAIDDNLISELVWVIPTRAGIDEFSLEVLRKQMVDASFLTSEEGDALTYNNGVATGNVRGIPFRAVHPDAMPDMDQPIILHIDTGYFKGMFKNEVATPLYDILHQTIIRIRQNDWQVLATTLSYSTEELMFSLDVRFLITALAKIIEDPNLLQKMPKAWKLHADAMYVGNMYLESKARDLIEEAVVTAPDDPVVVYALSQVRIQQGRAEEAFILLDKAVKLDPGYATAYIQLSENGVRKGDLDKALELIRKAIVHYPDNPFLKLNEVDILLRLKRTTEAIDRIHELQQLPWSGYYHVQAVDKLKEMEAHTMNPQRTQPGKTVEEK